MPSAYVITPNYNGLKFLRNYFRSLLEQTYSDFRIIFIDNASSDGSVEFIKNDYREYVDERIVLIENDANIGFAASNNQGIRLAMSDPQCKYIVCLNNDTVVDRDFLRNLILMAEQIKDAGSVQAKMIWGSRPDLIDSAGLEYSINGLGFNRGAYEPAEKFEWETEIFGCCAGACLYKREALEDVEVDGEYFDEDFFAYYEDFDLALRLRMAGWSSWYAPKSTVYHHKGGTKTFVSDFTIYHNWRNCTWTFLKNMPASLIIRYIPFFLLSKVIQVLINLKRGKTIILKAKYDAYRNLGRIIRKRKNIKRTYESNLKEFLKLKWRVNVPKN